MRLFRAHGRQRPQRSRSTYISTTSRRSPGSHTRQTSSRACGAEFGRCIAGLKDSSGDLDYAARIAAHLARASRLSERRGGASQGPRRRVRRLHLGERQRECGILRPRFPCGDERRSRQRREIRALVSRKPLIASVKAVLARMMKDAAFEAFCPHLRLRLRPTSGSSSEMSRHLLPNTRDEAMTERFHAFSARGIEVTVDLAVGHLRSVVIERAGRRLTPLYTAPWVDDPAIRATSRSRRTFVSCRAISSARPSRCRISTRRRHMDGRQIRVAAYRH